jgi:TM2 domain-containing membrane protein YozV
MPIFPFTILLLFVISFAEEGQPPLQEQSAADKRGDLLGATTISRVHTLNDAKGSYKSPKKALFMSLIIPGSGQFYVGSKQSRYMRGSFYLAEEMALISGLYYHSIYKYNKQVKRYQNFAKENFFVNQYEDKMNYLYNPSYEDNFNRFYREPERESYCKSFFGNEGYKPCVDNFGENYNGYPGDNTPIRDPSAYYRAIAHETLVLGWIDAVQANGIENNLYETKTEYMLLGTSEKRNEYLSIRKKANDLAGRQAIFLGAIILNHIVSAIDAALSARAHNNSLYEEKLSFLDRIRLGSDFHIGENFRAEAGLRLGF